VKRVKAERRDGFLVVEDVERISDNFPDKAARKVRMTAKYPLINDTTFDFTRGHWSTNQTKVYYSVGGDVRLKELEDEKESDLLAHLQEMNVKTDIAARQNEKKREETTVATAKTKSPPQQSNHQQIPDAKKNSDVVKNSPPLQSPVIKASSENENIKEPDEQSLVREDRKAEVVSANTKENKSTQQQIKTQLETSHKPDMSAIHKKKEQPVAIANTNLNKPTQAPVIRNDVATNVGGVQASSGNTPVVNKPNETRPVEKKKPDVVQVSQRNDQAINRPEEQKNISAVSINKPIIQQKEMTGPVKELPAVVADRKNETIQDIYFKNDSLVLSLYDNGIVDGDTVSVFMNGENIISRQKLKEAAIKKTIYVSNSDTVQLVLFAENLGTIPPNTGLLTVRDGDDVYQVRFSADLQKNASIILRRKK
jgi:hypothetical protein